MASSSSLLRPPPGIQAPPQSVLVASPPGLGYESAAGVIISNLNNQLFPTTHLRLGRVLHSACHRLCDHHPWQLINVTPSKALISLISISMASSIYWMIGAGEGYSIMEGGGSKCCHDDDDDEDER